MMLYCSTIEFKQKIFLKRNHNWTVPEIMTLYAFVLIVKYAKGVYWVPETYKITSNTCHCLRSIIQSQRLAEMCWIAPKFCFVIAFSRFPLCNGFSNCLNGDLLSLVFDCLFEVLLICSRRPSYTKSCRISHTQLYSPFEKAAQLYAKNESEHLTNQQHETLKNAT